MLIVYIWNISVSNRFGERWSDENLGIRNTNFSCGCHLFLCYIRILLSKYSFWRCIAEIKNKNVLNKRLVDFSKPTVAQIPWLLCINTWAIKLVSQFDFVYFFTTQMKTRKLLASVLFAASLVPAALAFRFAVSMRYPFIFPRQVCRYVKCKLIKISRYLIF